MSNNGKKRLRKKKAWWLRLAAWLHLWLGLIAGIVVFVVCFTGTVVVFADEIMNARQTDALYVQPQGPKLPTERLLANVRAAYPDNSISYFVTYHDPKRSLKVLFFDAKHLLWGYPHLMNVFVDPYTGRIIRSDETIMFFFITAHIHSELLLGKTGKMIVDISTIIFLAGLLTGLILWWPAKWNKHNKTKSFAIKWRANFKRVNYDLHNVLGFYTLPVTLILTLTGLVLAYEPVAQFTIKFFGGDPSRDAHKMLQTMAPAQKEAKAAGFDATIQKYMQVHPNDDAVMITIPRGAGFYRLAGGEIKIKNYKGTAVFIDKNTGHEIPLPQQVALNEEIENINMMLHMGSWYGWPAKILTFIGGFIGTSLPVTGFLIWWGRKKKEKKQSGLPAGKKHMQTSI